MKKISIKPVTVKYIHTGVKCTIWQNGHLGNCNLTPHGTTVINEKKVKFSVVKYNMKRSGMESG